MRLNLKSAAEVDFEVHFDNENKVIHVLDNNMTRMGSIKNSIQELQRTIAGWSYDNPRAENWVWYLYADGIVSEYLNGRFSHVNLNNVVIHEPFSDEMRWRDNDTY